MKFEFEFEIPTEWINLRGFGALRGYIRADSEEEAREMLKDEDVAWRYGDFEIDDYEIMNFEFSTDVILKEVD